jgi:hypothetical protein
MAATALCLSDFYNRKFNKQVTEAQRRCWERKNKQTYIYYLPNVFRYILSPFVFTVFSYFHHKYKKLIINKYYDT